MPNKIQIWELKQRQSLPLEAKITLAKIRIEQFHTKMDGNVCVSFSGGKDSTVLLHLVRSIYPDVKAVFVNTGLEWPEVVQFVKETENTEIIPKGKPNPQKIMFFNGKRSGLVVTH